jgi:hypothetical protein
MAFWFTKPKPVDSPVLVVDALGFTAKIKSCGKAELQQLSGVLNHQYHRFRSKIPFQIVGVTPTRVFGSSEFSAFRLNDMFVFFSEKPATDAPHRHLVSAVLLQQVLLLEGFIPRGGLGFGLVLRSDDSLLGGGFIDAYEAAEKRPERLRHICAIMLSRSFLARVPRTAFSSRLLRFFDGAYFVDPLAFTDPDMGQFDNERVLQLLKDAGTDDTKMAATKRFLDESEDYEAAAKPGSRSWKFVHSHGGASGPGG